MFASCAGGCWGCWHRRALCHRRASRGSSRGSCPVRHAHADLLVTHPTHSVEGVVRPLLAQMTAQGMLLPAAEAFCHVQVRTLAGWLVPGTWLWG